LFQTKLEIEIFKDVILPKIFYLYLDKVYTRRSYCCTKEEKDESESEDRLAKRTSIVKNGLVKINLHNLLLIKAMKAYEDIFESSSSLLSNASSLISFEHRNQELCLDWSRLLRRSIVCRDRMLVQLAVQNCTNLQCFVVHGIHCWKALGV